MATQTDRQRIYDAVINIRKLARDEDLTIRRDLKKSPEWKERLLPLLKREFILKQLETLQPYCYIGWNGTSWEFELPYFYYSIYVKINIDRQEVVSFHYSVNNEENTLIVNQRVKSWYDSGDSEVLDVILDSVYGTGYLRLNIGYMSVSQEVMATRSDMGTYCIYKEDYLNIVSNIKKDMLTKMLRSVSKEVTANVSRSQLRNLPNVNILSFGYIPDGDDLIKKEFNILSFCLDVYNYDKELFNWVEDYVRSYMFSVKDSDAIMERLVKQYPGMAGMESIKQISETTSEFGGVESV